MACRDIVPLGRTKSNFNYNLDEKRVLNFENIVNDDDNIKQDISIDVYGRAEKEEGADATAPAEKQVSIAPSFSYTSTQKLIHLLKILPRPRRLCCKLLLTQILWKYII